MRVLLISFLSVSLALATANAEERPAASDPWRSLWANDFTTAANAFKAAVENDSDDLASRRGLILAYLSLGRERHAIDELVDLSKKDHTDIRDFLLTEHVYRVTMTGGSDEKAFGKIYERLANRAELDPLDRRVVLEAVARFAMSNVDVRKARRVARDLGRIRAWSVLGPFENISGFGHETDHLMLDSKPLFREYTGKAGLRFTWHTPREIGNEGVLEFGDHLARETYLTAYAGTFLDTDEPGDYTLCFSKRGGLVVTLDGGEILSIDDPAEQREVHHARVTLGAGRHLLLCRVSGEDESPLLSMSILAPDGERADDVEISPLESSPVAPAAMTFRAGRLPLIDRSRSASETRRDDPQATFWWLHAMITFRLHEAREAGDILDSTTFGESSLLRDAVGTVLSAAGDDAGARHHFQMMSENDPTFSESVLWLAAEKYAADRITEADSLLVAASRREPEFGRARIALLASYQSRGLTAETVSLAEALIDQFPGEPQPHWVLAEHYRSFNPDRARHHDRAGARLSPRSMELVHDLTDAIYRSDDRAMAKAMEEILELYPESADWGVQTAMAKLRAGDAGAIDAVKQLSVDFPYSPGAQALRAGIEEFFMQTDPGRRATAIAYYERALALDPGDFDLREKLRALRGRKPIAEILPPFDAPAVASRGRGLGDQAGSDAVVLLDQHRRIVFDDGSSYSEKAFVIKVLTEAGVESFGSLSTGVNPFYSNLSIKNARTYKPDGRALEAKRGAGHVEFDSLEPGDTIAFVFGYTNWALGSLSGEFWDSHVFQWGVPCLRSTYELLAPGALDFDWTVHNDPESACTSSREIVEQVSGLSLTLYTWTMDDLDAREDEAAAPPTRDIVPWLDISTISSWSSIVEWYRALTERPSRPEPAIEREAAALLDGVMSDVQPRVETLFRFVSDRIKYEDLSFMNSAFVPEPAEDVLEARVGDCKDQVCLLRSLASSAGLECYFALVSPITSGMTPYLPSPRFWHVVLAMPTDSGYRFLDPTARGVSSRTVPLSLQGAPVLVIAGGVDSLSMIPYAVAKKPENEMRSTVRVEPSGDVLIDRHEVYRDDETVAELRTELSATSKEERRRRLTATLGRTALGVELVEFEWQGLASLADTLALSYRARMRGAVTASGDLRLVKLPWRTGVGERLMSFISNPDRRHALVLHGLKTYERERLEIFLPDGWTLESAPDDVVLSHEHGDFEMKRPGSTGLTYDRLLRISAGRLGAEAYAPFRQFLEDVARSQDGMLVVRARGG